MFWFAFMTWSFRSEDSWDIQYAYDVFLSSMTKMMKVLTFELWSLNARIEMSIFEVAMCIHNFIITKPRFIKHIVVSPCNTTNLQFMSHNACESSFEILVVASLQVVSQMKTNIFSHCYEKCALTLWTHKKLVDSWFPPLGLNPQGIIVER